MFQVRMVSILQSSVLCWAIAGCGVTPPSGGGGEPPAGRVFVLEGPTGSGGVEIIHVPSAQQAPSAGDILVGTSGDGFLRRAESVSVQPDGTQSVETSQATIAEAAREGDFSFTDSLPNAKGMVQTKRYEVFELAASLDRTLYSSNGVTIGTSGSFTLDLTIDLEMQVRGAKMELFRAAIEGTAGIELTGDIEAIAGASFEREVSLLGEPRRKYLYGVIGGIPVVIVVTADVLAGASGSMNGSATLTTGVGASSFMRVGAEYSSDRWSVIADEGLDYGYTGPVWCVQGELGAKVYIRPVIELQLYGVLGPKFDLEPYLEYSADASACGGAGLEPTGGYDWELAGGLAAHAKVKVDILDRFMIESPTLTVFDLRWILAEGHGDTPPTDFDDDGVPDDTDNCRYVYNPSQGDRDRDDVGDDCDDCPNDSNKTDPGECGCGKVDTPNCGQPVDNCPSDPNKTEPGLCGCGVSDTDSDGDGTPNCSDACPNDVNKTSQGNCGCGNPETPGCGETGCAGSGNPPCTIDYEECLDLALLEHGSGACENTGSEPGPSLEFFDVSLPSSISPGQTGTFRVDWNRCSDCNPNAVIYSSLIGDWAPTSPLNVRNSYFTTCGETANDTVTFTAPSQAGTYRVRWILCYAFDAIRNFCGEHEGGNSSDPGACPYIERAFEVSGIGPSVYADFSQQTIAGTISISVGQSFRWNDFYQIWRIESSGGGFTGSFNSPSGGTYQLVVDHTSSASSGCQGGGYSPVTIRVNGTTVANCWDPAANNGGTHGSAIDEWTINLNAGANTIEWTACNLCTHYWIRSIEIR